MDTSAKISQNKAIRRKLFFILSLTALYMVAEVIGGIITNSLALLADAGHMLGDVTALSMSFLATFIIEKPASDEKTYGYYRTEIIVALINGVLLIGISFFILYKGIMRFISPQEVKGFLMMMIASGGLVINLIGLATLHSSSRHNLNVKGAFYHVIGDALGSVGAITAGLIIYFFKFYYADIIISFLIGILIIISASKLIKESFNILLEGTPQHLDINEIKETVLKIPEVQKVHELHVWSISLQRVALSVHVITNCPDTQSVLYKVDSVLRKKFGINHLTIQVEPPKFPERHCDF